MNLMDWLGDNVWAIWLALALLLASAEMMTLDLTLIMLAAGALAGCGVALVAPGLVWLQIVVAVAVSLSMLVFLRPSLLKKVRDSIPGYRSSSDVVGASGTVTRAITAAGGEVRVAGETWSARPYVHDMVIEAGEEIEVFEIDGVTAVVYPKNRPLTSE